MPCWMRPRQPTTTTPPVADQIKLSGSATGSAASRMEMGDRTQCRVAADSPWSTDLIQAIRVPVGRGVVAAVGAGAGAGPMSLLGPGASPAGSDRGSAVISAYAVRELYLLIGLAT